MSEHRTYTTGFSPEANPETTRAMTDIGMSAWMQITQQLVDHTFKTLGNQMELGRRMVGSRSISEFLDAQAELNQLTMQSAVECSRRITETGQHVAREVTDRIAETVHVAAENTAQQARATEEQFRATTDQAQNVMKTAAHETDEAVARAAKARAAGVGSEAPDPTKTDPNRNDPNRKNASAPR